jgi:hypothetical protein
MTFTVTNPGTAALNVSGTAMAGADPNDFTVSTNDCNAPIMPRGTCTISVIYAPTGQGARTATLELSTNAGTGTQVVALSGTTLAAPSLTAPVIRATPYYNSTSSVSFGTVTASLGTAPYSFTTNLTSATGDWTLVQSGASASIEGTPTQTGPVAYTITVTDNVGAKSTASGTLSVQKANSFLALSESEVQGVAGTAATITGIVNQSVPLAAGAVSPTGTTHLQLDFQSPVAVPIVANGATAGYTFYTDILYHAVNGTYGGDINYTPQNYTTLIGINGNRPQAITFAGGLTAPDGSTIALTARASSGLPVVYTVTGGPGTIDSSGMNLLLTGTGQVQVTASQPGNNSFAPATTVTAVFTSD